eukprot:CAMPEP_0179881966 /NCGR_PEP_ID=MMETSP0982-20121206/27855_1 /TAXON_ID=483367 /ORGANISM="non described non described, Strain CCMP 2436" /LENGTH=74 /DNA_ID=CAMNT_0021776167 /DNA_START=1138 /DNA_END=1362 /DNA_ORIENTATION=-
MAVLQEGRRVAGVRRHRDQRHVSRERRRERCGLEPTRQVQRGCSLHGTKRERERAAARGEARAAGEAVNSRPHP